MKSVVRRAFGFVLVANLVALTLVGCQAARKAKNECPSPVSQGINPRDMVDKQAQDELDAEIDLKLLEAKAQKLRDLTIKEAKENWNPNAPPYDEKTRPNILCLSGGGSFGAFTAGVMCGWTAKGDRPVFDVVTGISTGALVAPFAFLGPAYDDQMKKFYTTLESKDLYKMTPVKGFLGGESLADNTKLGEKVDEVLTPQVMAEVAQAHQQGRRLYIGTTAAESKRFVIWDIGAIACRGRPQDRALIRQILLGSSAIPGVFPPQHITVDLDGQCFTERHVDGGVSQSLFMYPPYVSPEHRAKNPNHNLAGANVYAVIAGKLYADPAPISKWAVALAATETSAMIYAQTRGDLQRMWTTSMLSGMNFRMTSIPITYGAPTSSLAFEIPLLVGMFNEGHRLACEGKLWRTLPPGVAKGENYNIRAGTCLNFELRGEYPPPGPPPGRSGILSDSGMIPLPPVK